jgi:hypothetical protein
MGHTNIGIHYYHHGCWNYYKSQQFIVLQLTQGIATKQFFFCLSLLPCHILQQLSMKVILLLLEEITTNMALLQQYFTMAIDPFSSSVGESYNWHL